MEKYRIIKIGFSYEVQRYGLEMLDGCPYHDWKTLYSSQNEDDARAMLDALKRGV